MIRKHLTENAGLHQNEPTSAYSTPKQRANHVLIQKGGYPGSLAAQGAMPQDWSFLFPPLVVGIEPTHPMHLSQVLAVSLNYTPNVANACFVLIFSYNF